MAKESAAARSVATATEKKKYSAPALEKGLQILEAISCMSEPLGPSAIANLVGRTNSEIVRLLYVLEDMGYIERTGTSGGYQITSRLFTIASARPATRSLLEIAFPLMREFATSIRQSCHVSVRTDTKIVVIGRTEAHRGMSLSVRVGHNRSIVGSASGTVLFAFLALDQQPAVLQELHRVASSDDIEKFVSDARETRKIGFAKWPNTLLKGINDYSVPIFRSGSVCAALTVPFVPLVDSDLEELDLVEQMKQIANRISSQIPPNEDY